MGPDVSKEAHEDEKYNKMDDTDQLDVKQDICDNICWCGYHKCFNDDEDNELKGINVAKLREDYENSLQEVFQCEVCIYKSENMENTKNHFMSNHRESFRFKCWDCNKEVKTISEFKQHIGTYHFTPVSERPNEH